MLTWARMDDGCEVLTSFKVKFSGYDEYFLFSLHKMGGVVMVELLTASVVYALQVVTNYKVPTYRYLWYLGKYSWF